MHLDESLLLAAKEGDPLILHLYTWENPSLTYGYFMQIEELLDTKRLKTHGMDFARRPTGGGVIFHLWDVAFSVILPKGHPFYKENTLDCYIAINTIVRKAVSRFLSAPSLLDHDPIQNEGHARYFCMAKPTIYDVMIGGKKVAGSAQRKKKNALLHQGTISLEAMDLALLSDVLVDKNAASLIEANGSIIQGKTKREIQEALILEFEQCV